MYFVSAGICMYEHFHCYINVHAGARMRLRVGKTLVQTHTFKNGHVKAKIRS